MTPHLAYPRSFAIMLLCAAALVPFSTTASTPDPVKLAIFDFEFEDMSAAASAGSIAASDTPALGGGHELGSRSLRAIGRYSLVDVGSADAAEVKAHTLRTCDGCDAAIAQQLGAEQSFVGVVKRITRTEYTVRYQIRDASTGAVLSSADSGLRMGADYSWSRGAVRLIKDRLLEKKASNRRALARDCPVARRSLHSLAAHPHSGEESRCRNSRNVFRWRARLRW